MVHSALKRKRYSGDSTQSSLYLRTPSPTTVVSTSSTSIGYNSAMLHRDPSTQSSSIHYALRTPPPPASSSPLLGTAPLETSHDPRLSVRILLELMTPSEFAKLLRSRVKRVLSLWPVALSVPPSHGLPSPTSSSSSISYKPLDMQDTQDFFPGTIQAFISFFRSEDMPAPHYLNLQELHKHLIALQTLLSFLTSQELRDIVLTRLNASGAERDRRAAVQGVLDVLRNTGTDYDDRNVDSDNDIPAEMCVPAHPHGCDGNVYNGRRKRRAIVPDVKYVDIGINTVSDYHVPTTGDRLPVGNSPSSPISTSSKRLQGHVGIERPRKRARTIVITKRYPRTMRTPPFLISRRATSAANVSNCCAVRPPMNTTTQSYAVAQSSPLQYGEISLNDADSHERRLESDILPESSPGHSPEKLTGMDAGRTETQSAQPVVRDANICTTHMGQRDIHDGPLGSPEDLLSNGVLSKCTPGGFSMNPPENLAMAPSPVVYMSSSSMDGSRNQHRNAQLSASDVGVTPHSPLISRWAPSPPSTPFFRTTSHVKNMSEKCATSDSAKTRLLSGQPPCQDVDIETDIDMDMSDDEETDEGISIDQSRACEQVLRIVADDPIQTGLQDHSMNTSSAKLASTVLKRRITLTNANSTSSQALFAHDITGEPKLKNIDSPSSAGEAVGNALNFPKPSATETGSSRNSSHLPDATSFCKDVRVAHCPSPPPATESSASQALLVTKQFASLRRPPPTFVPAQLPQPLSVPTNNPQGLDSNSFMVRPPPPSPPTLQVKRELYESSLSATGCAADSSVNGRNLNHGDAAALQSHDTVPNPMVSSDAIGSEMSKQGMINGSLNDTGPAEMTLQLANVNVEAVKHWSTSYKLAGAGTRRSPPVAPKGRSNTSRLASFHSGRPKMPTSGQNMISVPSAPRAMASVMPVARAIFLAPTGAPTSMTTLPSKPSLPLRPEGPELPLPSERYLVTPMSLKTIPTLSARKGSIPSSTRPQRTLKGKLKQEHIPKSPSSPRQHRRSSSSSSSSSSASSPSSSRSRSRSRPIKHSRGRTSHRHRLPRRRPVSPSVSSYSGTNHTHSRSPRRAVVRRRSKRSTSRSTSCSPFRSSVYRRRNYSYSRPPSPPFRHDSPVAQPSNRRYRSPDSDRDSRGRRLNRRDESHSPRRLPSHDHWSPGRDTSRGRHSSRPRWISNESLDSKDATLLVDADVLAQPMNPHSGGRMTCVGRRKIGA